VPDPRYQVSVGGQTLDPSVLGLLTRIEVRESDAEPTVAALRFNAAQTEAGEYSPIDDGIFTPSAKISIQVEAPGGNPIRIFEGYVTHVRPHFELLIESNSYVEILAMDAAVLLNAEERVQTYEDVTDSDAAQQIFQRYGITFSGDTTNARYDKDKHLLVQRATDWEFVQRLARRNGLVCYLEPDPQSGDVTAYFKARALKDAPQADLTVLRDGANVKWIDLQAVLTGPVRHVGAAIDPIEGSIVTSDGTPVDPPLGDTLLDGDVEGGLKQAGATAATALLRDPLPLEAAIAAQGSAATDRALYALEARGEIDTLLYRGLLRARRPVLIKGVGRAFAGVYYVRAVRTTLNEGMIAQTFVAERNAFGLSGHEKFGQDAEEIPPQ
jgi:Phage tail baseplate hub (GPD)